MHLRYNVNHPQCNTVYVASRCIVIAYCYVAILRWYFGSVTVFLFGSRALYVSVFSLRVKMDAYGGVRSEAGGICNVSPGHFNSSSHND